MSVKSSDGPVNERDSANAIPTLLVHARRSLISTGSDLTRGDLIDLIENDDATAEMMLAPIDGLPEVPLEVVEASGWMDVAWGRWLHRNESIIVLENRALTRGVEILESTQQLFRKRCVALVDNRAAQF